MAKVVPPVVAKRTPKTNRPLSVATPKVAVSVSAATKPNGLWRLPGARTLQPVASLATLEVRAPGTPATALNHATGPLPKVSWPATRAEAEAVLVQRGFKATRTVDGSTEFVSGRQKLALTPMTLAATEGYVVSRGDTRHVQLGDLSFTGEQWSILQQGYERELNAYNALLPRPKVLQRGALPRDGSDLHGPQDGLKHLLGLVSGDLRALRENKVALNAVHRQIRATIEQARAKGTMPKNVVIVVEGLDGASKTGNGLTLSRLLEDAGFEVKTKAFRAPTAEERSQGVMGRYRDFVDPGQSKGPTTWFLDRGFPGDFVHNPTADVTSVAEATHEFERSFANNPHEKTLFVKMLFSPGEQAPLATFGKRIARAQIAEDMLARRPELSAAERASLETAATLKPGFGDFRSVTISKDVQARYEAFARANEAVNPWAIIDTSERHEGRLAAAEYFLYTLQRSTR